jgi:hypothetical protein
LVPLLDLVHLLLVLLRLLLELAVLLLARGLDVGGQFLDGPF